jgi:hypothetical protein
VTDEPDVAVMAKEFVREIFAAVGERPPAGCEPEQYAADDPAPPTSPVTFRDATPEEFVAARGASTRPGYLSGHSVESLRDAVAKGGGLRLSHDGRVGYLLTHDKDLQNVFNNGGGKGAGKYAIEEGIARGAQTLDAFHGYLPKFYAKFGFRATHALPWDDQYAPANWDYHKHGRPDVIFMRYEGDTRDPATIHARHESGVYPNYVHPGAPHLQQRFPGRQGEVVGGAAAGARGPVGAGQLGPPGGGVGVHRGDVLAPHPFAATGPTRYAAADAPAALKRAESADLVTLPDDVSGTTCASCQYVRVGPRGGVHDYCDHEKVDQPLPDTAERMCCRYWDRPGTKRAWRAAAEQYAEPVAPRPAGPTNPYLAYEHVGRHVDSSGRGQTTHAPIMPHAARVFAKALGVGRRHFERFGYGNLAADPGTGHVTHHERSATYPLHELHEAAVAAGDTVGRFTVHPEAAAHLRALDEAHAAARREANIWQGEEMRPPASGFGPWRPARRRQAIVDQGPALEFSDWLRGVGHHGLADKIGEKMAGWRTLDIAHSEDEAHDIAQAHASDNPGHRVRVTPAAMEYNVPGHRAEYSDPARPGPPPTAAEVLHWLTMEDPESYRYARGDAPHYADVVPAGGVRYDRDDRARPGGARQSVAGRGAAQDAGRGGASLSPPRVVHHDGGEGGRWFENLDFPGTCYTSYDAAAAVSRYAGLSIGPGYLPRPAGGDPEATFVPPGRRGGIAGPATPPGSFVGPHRPESAASPAASPQANLPGAEADFGPGVVREEHWRPPVHFFGHGGTDYVAKSPRGATLGRPSWGEAANEEAASRVLMRLGVPNAVPVRAVHKGGLPYVVSPHVGEHDSLYDLQEKAKFGDPEGVRAKEVFSLINREHAAHQAFANWLVNADDRHGNQYLVTPDARLHPIVRPRPRGAPRTPWRAISVGLGRPASRRLILLASFRGGRRGRIAPARP